MSPSRFHRQLCGRPLSSPSPAPASFLRKLGSPREQVCPWGKPLAPCLAARRLTFGRTEEGFGAPTPPSLHAHVLAQAGGSAAAEESEKREAEACRNLGPVRAPGRPQRSCSLQQVRRTRARSPLRSRHLLRRPGDPSHRPRRGAPGRRRPRLSFLPRSSRRRRLFRGKAGSASSRALWGFSSRALWGSSPRVGAARADGSRPTRGLLSRFGPGPAPGPPQAPLLVSSAARQHRGRGQLPPAPDKAAGLGPRRSVGVGVGVGMARGDFAPSPAVSGRAEEGGLVAIALRSTVHQGLAVQWRVPAGSQEKGGRRDRYRRS